MAGWQSLAQWVGTPKGEEAIDQVAAVWPGYRRHAQRSALNAYYTDPGVIDSVWAHLARHGVTEGHGFEPGAGRGDWITAAPDGFTFDAVDIDPVTVEVARWRTGANVVECPIEEWDIGRSSVPDQHGYDVVVGNVPFAAYRPAVNNPHRDNLHNLSIARSVAMLRPGGIAAVLTSRYTLDSKNSGFRERLAADVDLVAAYRLPSGTHREAGTDVVTDILLLRRPLEDEVRPAASWLTTEQHQVANSTGDDVNIVWNTYWDRHPDRVLGRVEPGGAYRRDDFHVRAGRPTPELLDEAFANAPALNYHPTGAAPARAGIAPVRTAAGRALPAGSIVVDPDSATGFSRDGRPHKCAAKNTVQLRALCGLRDSALDYFEVPTEEGRTELATLYVDYRESFQPLNWYQFADATPADVDDVVDEGGERPRSARRYPRLEGFRSDPSWWTVAALEAFDDDTMQAQPAALLSRDDLAENVDWPDQATDVTHAAINSLSRHHRIDVDYIATQLHTSTGDVEGELEAIAYRMPVGGWELNDRYLAGDVVGKLEAATIAADTDPRFGRNIDALIAALPTPLTPSEISAEFGVTWLEPADIGLFIAELGGGTPHVMYHPPTGEWSMNGWAPPGPSQFRRDNRSMTETVLAMCNAKPATVWEDIDLGGGRTARVVATDKTAAEQLARDNLTEALQAWVWSDPERTERLTARYNRMFNRYVAETWDGSHLTLPGLSAGFSPRPHQKDVVWRILAANDTGTLMAHGVGAGKTAAMVIAGYEARRTGRVNGTTLYAVPGNMVEQFARDYLTLYPAARVITPTGTNQTEATREFAARVATGDFDAAICSHGVLKRIPLSPDMERESLNRRIDEFESVNPDTTLSKAAAKRAARRLAVFQEKLKGLSNAAEDPNTTYFDRMGIGSLFVDEAHLAKNIVLGTERQGLPIPEGSQIAEAVLARADYVRSQHGPRSVVMATATPVTNSPAEMWVMARLVAPETLIQAGIERFDPFAANFLAPTDSVELDAGGRLKVVTRLGEYRNFPDLARIFRAFTDVRPTATLGFTLPHVAGGGAVLHAVDPTDQQLDAASWARERAERQHLHLEHDDRDPVIAIMTMSKMAALHPACVSNDITQRWATSGFPDLSFSWDEPNNKLIEAADTISEIHHRTSGWRYDNSTVPGAAQVVFCDWGTPKPAAPSVYSTLTNLLTQRGVDRNQIAWVHDVADPAKRQTLWDDVRSGNVRVLIGSTAQMGVGVNIQTRLYATHELTFPATGRPDGLEQGEGRMIRQGNTHDTVELHRYVTQRTADAAGWQMLHRKQHFITQAMSDPDTLTRDLRDESVITPAEEFAEIAAIATGDPRHVQLAALTATVTRLERTERAHSASRTNQARNTQSNHRTIAANQERIGILEALQPTLIDDVTVIGGEILDIRPGSEVVRIYGGVPFRIDRRYDSMTITIDGVNMMPSRLDRTALNPADDGRGVGNRVANMIDRIPTVIHESRESIRWVQSQIDADQARPVPERFPRHDELVSARTERDRIQQALLPTTEPTVPAAIETITSHVPVDQVVERAPSPVLPTHPVWGPNEPPTRTAQAAWSGAFQHFEPDRQPHWGNKAKGLTGWAEAVNAYARHQPIDPGKRHDIGIYRGVSLAAAFPTTGAMHIEIRHSFQRTNTWPTHTAATGQIDTAELDKWITECHDHATSIRHDLGFTPARQPHRIDTTNNIQRHDEHQR